MTEVSQKPARTRIAPSPTGELHIGTLRTLLYDYALARQTGGQFIFRLEDTDQKRYVEGSETRLMEVIKKYGLDWDEGPDIGGPYGPYIQTERLDIYHQYVNQLLDKGLAYYCFCTQERLDDLRATQKAAKQVPRYDQHCLNLSQEEIKQKLAQKIPYTIRMVIPKNETIICDDLIRGRIKFNTNDVDDQVLIKSNGIPTYHFAVVVDDHLMKITHAFRGEEWLTSTPKHILLYRYFGWQPPIFAHLTVLLNADGKGKMSKRSGTTHAQAFLDEGYLPEAVLNFLMLQGWNPGDDREFFSLEEFVKTFSLDRLHKKSPIFDPKKLNYFNGYYIRQKTDSELLKLVKPFIPELDDHTLTQLIPLLRDRISTLKNAADLVKFISTDIDYSPDLFTQKGIALTEAKNFLTAAKNMLESQSDWSFDNLQIKLLNLVKDNNWHTGHFFMVFRIAICGSPFTLPIVEVLPILGKDKTVRKIDIALNKLGQ